MTAPRWLPAAAAAVFAAALAWLNRGERVAIDVGVVTFYRAPLAVVLLLVFLAGMGAMLMLSLRHDRRVRELLRSHGLLQPEAPPARAASAWGVAREPVPTRDDTPPATFARTDEAAVSHPRADEPTSTYPVGDERTAVFSGQDERPYVRDDEPAAAHPVEDQRPVSYARDDERTIAYPREDDRTVSYPREDERRLSYPRLDEDPAT
ncbi:hypothetical protein [Longimicrobium sp.]|uniref:hypothetical protein n=1 Tax=Longimicrobium sp. TaxID=2029185 RepID=UPI003B3A2C7D